MNLPFEIDRADLTLGVIALCLLLYLWHRVKQRRLARMHSNRDTETQPRRDGQWLLLHHAKGWHHPRGTSSDLLLRSFESLCVYQR